MAGRDFVFDRILLRIAKDSSYPVNVKKAVDKLLSSTVKKDKVPEKTKKELDVLLLLAIKDGKFSPAKKKKVDEIFLSLIKDKKIPAESKKIFDDLILDIVKGKNLSKQDQKVFDQIIVNAIRDGKIKAKVNKAINWFKGKSSKVSDSSSRIFSEANKERKSKRIEIGRMYFYKYDAKTKAKLPYWDAVPLIFPFSEEGPHFIGINLHYAPPKQRAFLLDQLYSISSNDSLDTNTKIKLKYSFLKSASRSKFFKPLIKKYLKSHVQSSFIEVYASEYPIAIFLPLASWRKAGPQKVFSDYRKSVAKK